MTSQNDEDSNPTPQITENSRAENNTLSGIAGGPLALQLPVDTQVWNEARRLVVDKTVRVEDLAACASQDPVIVIELLKIANAMYFAGGRSPISSVKTAIVRLGSDVVIETLDKLLETPVFENVQINHWFEVFRSRCRRASIVSRIFAEVVARTLSEDCQAAGLLVSVGEMVAVAHFKDTYVKLTEEHSRAGVNYQLAQTYRFDVENVGLRYLRKVGIPETLLYAIDRDARARNPERTVMRPVVQSACELVDAFDANRWEKMAPGRNLPPKSAIRTLQLNDAQYLKVYERSAEYLFSSRLAEEQRSNQPAKRPVGLTHVEHGEQQGKSVSLSSAEISALINTKEEVADQPRNQPPISAPQMQTKIAAVPEKLPDVGELFSLPNAQERKTVARIAKTTKVEPPKLRTAGGNAVVNSISKMFEGARSSEDLLSDLLTMLTKGGPFEKAALIVVSRDRNHAIVVASRGPKLGTGQKLTLDDPLSPLAQCFSKVQSFGNRKSKESPFGSKAFALAPIDADHDTPVALYADCGDNGSITFEARRIFRTVVEILNQKLPTIPGGIPVELDQ